MIEYGRPNIIYAQSSACLPGHIVGKGMFRALRTRYPEANTVAVDYDPSASEVNQLNRIKLVSPIAIERRKGSGEEPEVFELHDIDFESEEGSGAKGLLPGARARGSAAGAASACDSAACGSPVSTSSAGTEDENVRSRSGVGSGTEGFERAQPVSFGIPDIPPRRRVAFR